MWVFVDIEGKAYWCFSALACYACRYCSWALLVNGQRGARKM